MKRILITAILISMLPVLAGCGEKIKPGEDETERPLVEGITLTTVAPSAIKEVYETSGTLDAENTSIVSARVMGIVKDIEADAGRRVKKGDLLLTIHSPDIEARVQAAGEAVKEAERGRAVALEEKRLMEKTFERYKKLYEGKAVTGQEFDEISTKMAVAEHRYGMAEKALKRAEAVLREAEAFRGYTSIYSPVDGMVAERMIDAGSMAAPGTPLFVIEEPGYRVEVPVDESLLEKITPGMSVDIYIDSLNLKTAGKVSEIVRRVDPLTRTFTVRVSLDRLESGFRGGLYCKAGFPVGERMALLVPAGAVVHKGALSGLYVVDEDGVMTLRLIRTGEARGGMVEVLSGLRTGERIVTDGLEMAIDGGRVKGDV
jgi:RND family efflux transporter MFP subunit